MSLIYNSGTDSLEETINCTTSIPMESLLTEKQRIADTIISLQQRLVDIEDKLTEATNQGWVNPT